jgi:DNA-binding NtrC family response regulator
MVGRINLIVIDDESSLEVLYAFFLENEIEQNIIIFDFYTSPIEALSSLRGECRQGKTVIISDFFMPEMSGADLGKIIKKEYPDISFYISTGMTEAELYLLVDKNSIAGVFFKPIDIEDIKDFLIDSEVLRKNLIAS